MFNQLEPYSLIYLLVSIGPWRQKNQQGDLYFSYWWTKKHGEKTGSGSYTVLSLKSPIWNPTKWWFSFSDLSHSQIKPEKFRARTSRWNRWSSRQMGVACLCAYIYIYLEHKWPLFFEGQPSKARHFPIKKRFIRVPCIYDGHQQIRDCLTWLKPANFFMTSLADFQET